MGTETTGIVVNGTKRVGLFWHVSDMTDGHTRVSLEVCDCVEPEELAQELEQWAGRLRNPEKLLVDLVGYGALRRR